MDKYYINRVKQLSLFIIFLCSSFVTARAGYAIQFCNRDSSGVCLGEGDVFLWNGGETPVCVMITNPGGIAIDKIEIKVLEMKNDQSGDIYTDVRLYTRPEWKTATKKINFVKMGYYKVEVYDQASNRLAEAYLTISDRNEETQTYFNK